MSCEDASPGMCFLGQQFAGTFFGCCFGTVTRGLYGEIWWSGVPGVVTGSTIGILAARNPDRMPELSSVVLIVVSTVVISLYVATYVAF